MKNLTLPSSVFSRNIENFEEDEGSKVIPTFYLPVGFNAFSLFHIAIFYDGSDSRLLSIEEVHKLLEYDDYDTGYDFSATLSSLFRFYEDLLGASSFASTVTDRSPNIFNNLTRETYGSTCYSVPAGQEDGITHLLTVTRNFDHNFFFRVDATIEDIPLSVVSSIGQPDLFYMLMDMESLCTNAARIKLARTNSKTLENGMFQMQWALCTVNRLFRLIINRCSHYIVIGDNYSASFTSADDAFDNAIIRLVVYKHSFFAPKIRLECRQKLSLFHPDVLISDKLYAEIALSTHIADKTIHSFILQSLEFPFMFYKESNFSDNLCSIAFMLTQFSSITAEATSLALQLMSDIREIENANEAANSYNMFLFWVRSLIAVAEGIVNDDIDAVYKGFSSCFYSLPFRIDKLIATTVNFALMVSQMFRHKKRVNDSWFSQMLILLRFVLGDNYDDQLKLRKNDIIGYPLDIPVTIDGCVSLFIPKHFVRETESIFSIEEQFESLFQSLKERGIYLDSSGEYIINNEYLRFIRIQAFEACILP